MERANLLSLFMRRWPIIIVLALLVFGVALVRDTNKPAQYFGSFTVSVQASRNYPSTQQLILQPNISEDLHTAIATTQSWLSDPFYVRKALTGAGLSSDALSLKDYSKTFALVTSSEFSSSYQVQYVGASEDEVQKVFASLKNVLTEAKESYDGRKGPLNIDSSFTEVTVTTKNSGVPLVPLAGLLAGAVLGFVIAALYDRTTSRA